MICKNKNEHGVCTQHNLQCGFPTCEQEQRATPAASPATAAGTIDAPEFRAALMTIYGSGVARMEPGESYELVIKKIDQHTASAVAEAEERGFHMGTENGIAVGRAAAELERGQAQAPVSGAEPIELELPDGDKRNARICWDEVRNGKRHVCITVDAAAPVSAPDYVKIAEELDAKARGHVELNAKLGEAFAPVSEAEPQTPEIEGIALPADAWVYECRQPWTDDVIWHEFFSRDKPEQKYSMRNIRPLVYANVAPTADAQDQVEVAVWQYLAQRTVLDTKTAVLIARDIVGLCLRPPASIPDDLPADGQELPGPMIKAWEQRFDDGEFTSLAAAKDAEIAEWRALAMRQPKGEGDQNG